MTVQIDVWGSSNALFRWFIVRFSLLAVPLIRRLSELRSLERAVNLSDCLLLFELASSIAGDIDFATLVGDLGQ